MFDICKTMLKFPSRVCFCLKVTCESVSYRLHVRELSYLTCVWEPCCAAATLCTPRTTVEHLYKQQQRAFASAKKRFRIKIPALLSDEPSKGNPMSDSLQPTHKHDSYGGQFEVTPNDDNLQMWRMGGTSCNDSSSRRIKSVPADFRVWESVEKKSSTSDSGSFRFKVLSYNVLAQYLLECHPYLYTECSPVNLKWKVRAARIYEEVVKLSPDILCFQEVQASHIECFYSKFEEIGYCGIFKQKTGHRQDGCAIYFKQSLFELMDQMSVEFYQPQMPILNRDNIGVMVKLRPRTQPAATLVVATTHLLYNPKRTDVRLAQVQVFLAEIDRFAFYSCGNESGHLPIIMTGDLNSTPDSAVIKLLDKGHVRASPFRGSSDWERIGVTDNCQHLAVYLDRRAGRPTDLSTIKIQNSEFESDPDGACPASPTDGQFSGFFNSSELGHSLRLRPVYERRKPDGCWEATTYQDMWLTVDYIYFSCCSNLKLVERLRLPTAEECEALGTLPNEVYGSDHLALAAAFELRPLKASL